MEMKTVFKVHVLVLQCVGVSKAPPRVYTVETTAGVVRSSTAGVVRSCHLTANSGR